MQVVLSTTLSFGFCWLTYAPLQASNFHVGLSAVHAARGGDKVTFFAAFDIDMAIMDCEPGCRVPLDPFQHQLATVSVRYGVLRPVVFEAS
eukprot:2822043-Amphidinium_carterae.1